MVLNPIAVFKLEPGTDVEVVADGKTYSAEFVAAKEYSRERSDVESDEVYVVHIGDSDAVIPVSAVKEVIKTDGL